MVVELASSQIENHTQPDDHDDDNLKLIIKESNHQNVNTVSIHIMYNI